MNMADEFDTLEARDTLTAGGFTDPQARALVAVLRMNHAETATKTDLTELATKHDLTKLKVELVLWVVAMLVAQGTAIVSILHYMK